MYKLQFRREGVDLLLYNQHLARLNSMDSTLKENHSKIQGITLIKNKVFP